MMRVLFVESLHHPERLREEKAQNDRPNMPSQSFPTSMTSYFYEKLMRADGCTVQVFWRNIPWASQDIERIRSQRHTEHLTPAKVVQALANRAPVRFNPDLRARNQALLQTARAYQPDLIWLAGGNNVIYPETLARIKAETGAILLYLNGVSPIVFSHPMEREASRLYDIVLVNDFYHGMQWREMGAPRVVCLPYVAIDPFYHRPSRPFKPEYTCDVAFVGTLVPHHLYSERIQALQALVHDFDVGIWTVHDVPDSLRPYVRGYALGKDMLDIISHAKISLNVHGDFMRYGGNMRLFESAGVRAFQIVDARDGIDTWFTPGEHLVTFSDVQDLREKVAYYLAHPDERGRMIDNALKHVRTFHTYEHRWQRIKQLLEEI